MTPDAFSARINKLPKWARDYIHNVCTFVGAEDVQELTFLRDQNRALIKLVGELKVENRRLRKRLSSEPAKKPAGGKTGKAANKAKPKTPKTK